MIFFDLLVLLTFVWFSRKLFQVIKFPPLFGEIFAGILAGPLILGAVADSESLQVLAELGIFFLMFHSGLELKPAELFKSSKKAILIALGGIVLPFAGGFVVAQWFGYESLPSVFVGLSLSVTAVAISARLFKDAKIHNTDVAHVTMAASIITEVLMLVILAVVLEVSRVGSVDVSHVILLIFKFGGYFSIVFFIGQKLFPFLYRVLYKGNKGFTFSLILALAFGVIAEMIGLHVIIGAFLAGLFLRQELLDPDVFEKIEDRVFGLSYSFLGPIFFATLAFHLDLSALWNDSSFFLILFFVAVLGKVIGSGLAAKIQGMNNCRSLAVGLAMNSRGAVDIILIALGLKMGIIDENLFSVLVLITFATTLLSIVLLKPLAPSIRNSECKMTMRERLRHIVT
jgi:Kef-type K+ transport system membrane component KefB